MCCKYEFNLMAPAPLETQGYELAEVTRECPADAGFRKPEVVHIDVVTGSWQDADDGWIDGWIG